MGGGRRGDGDRKCGRRMRALEGGRVSEPADEKWDERVKEKA